MGRSVSYPIGAIVAFRLIENKEEGDLDWEYECQVEDIISTAREVFPSLVPHDGWRGREDRILLRNAYADCGISIYCDLAAIWLAERDDSFYWEADYSRPRTGRAQRWLEQVSGKFSQMFGELRQIGSFSNGEAVFERIEARTAEVSKAAAR
ncbi:hypothetical protein [Croceicoccus sp. YJ47]|uniref:hypothetical protein n=1 Tax=Croceicoccus sp. YJ47 TaxID=2798724 RepID=UPI0019250D2E|nr:hypothetical protein [Croceicoccus sp. YJ47]QQN75210.1 hypothetical protein JD971_05955 [Croceicoccus sp. YJ47]